MTAVAFTGLADQLVALQRQADDALRAKDALLGQVQGVLDDVGPGLYDQLDEAGRISDDVFDSLRPYSGQFGTFQPIPAEVRTAGVTKLDEAMRLHDQAIQGIDDALGAGTWMGTSVRETRAFHAEARRVLADPTLGPDSADHAIDLLRQNGYAYDEAARMLRDGNVDRLLSRDIHTVIDHATPEMLEGSASWRTVYTRADG
jgi:hypothetical protein